MQVSQIRPFLKMKTYDPELAKTEQPHKRFITVQMSAEELFAKLSQMLVSDSRISKIRLDLKYLKFYYFSKFTDNSYTEFT